MMWRKCLWLLLGVCSAWVFANCQESAPGSQEQLTRERAVGDRDRETTLDAGSTTELPNGRSVVDAKDAKETTDAMDLIDDVVRDDATVVETTRPEPASEPAQETIASEADASSPEPLVEKPECRVDDDCGKPSCQQSGSNCQWRTARCLNGACVGQMRPVKSASCHAATGSCLYDLPLCQASYEGALLATAIYPSEPISALPSKFKLVKTIKGKNGDGTMMLFVSGVPHALCHVVFKGVSPGSTKDLYAALSSVKTTSCTTTQGTKLGNCGNGFFNQYDALRKAGAVTFVEGEVKGGKCPGGLWVYGHSMGGAQASLFASELVTLSASRYHKAYLRAFTYGAPRLYTNTPADRFHKLIQLYRWINEGDPIPSVPPSALGFRHFGKTYEITRKNGKVLFQSEGQNASPTIDFLDMGKAHKYSTYANRLQKCTGVP